MDDEMTHMVFREALLESVGRSIYRSRHLCFG